MPQTGEGGTHFDELKIDLVHWQVCAARSGCLAGVEKRTMVQITRAGLLLALTAVASINASAQGAEGAALPQCVTARSETTLGSRIAGDWRASAAVVIADRRLPLPQDSVDMGVAPAETRLERMLLLLQPSQGQQDGLDAAIERQQTIGSCAFHRWLTAAQFADAFANSAADVKAVAEWLSSFGFEVAPVPEGRGWVEFSGTAGQVEQAFHAPVRVYLTAGGKRLALSDNISVPGALRPLIHGMVSLDGALSAAAMTLPRDISTPAAELAAKTSAVDAEAVTPKLMAHLAGLESLHAGGSIGAGETIAIAARSNVQAADIAAFRASFGLPEMPVTVEPNGADPGMTSDQAAAEFAASWAGATAPGARILVVPAATTSATDGVDLSLAALVDQGAAHTLVVGYSACEASLSEAHRAFYAALYRQAAMEGISAIAATGDSGASACHAAGGDARVNTGYGVNALASTSWNTAVGAAAFASRDASELSAWSTGGAAGPAYASGGGASAEFSRPAWQPEALKDTQHRLLPDLSLPTGLDAAWSRGLVFCFSGTTAGVSGCRLVRSGGSSAAAAIFAGMSALIAQKYGAQGNLAPQLYRLSGRAGIFTDVQQGSARLACAAGSPGCDASGMIGYDAANGFDLATGLGVPNADNLVKAWATPAATGTGATSVVLTVSPVAVNATYNPSSQITFTASVASMTSGTAPTGTVQFFDKALNANLGTGPVTLDANGNATLTLSSGFATGGNNITAVYSGDATYASQTSPTLTLTVEPSTTFMTITPSTLTPAAGTSITVVVTMTVGIPPAGTVPPSGKVTLNLDGLPNSTASLVTAGGVTTATFTLVVPTTGSSHNLQAIYPGDANYTASTSPAVSITLTKGATVTTLTVLPSVLTPGSTETLTASVSPVNPPTGTTFTITGSITFYDGAVLLGVVPLAMNTASLSNVVLSTATSHLITAVYSGDVNWSPSTSNPVTLIALLFADTVTLTVSPTAVSPGQVVTLIATVTPAVIPASTTEQNPTGNVIFYDGTNILGTVALSAGANNTATATLLNATLPAGQDVLYAFYVGDLFYASGTSNSITISVQDFSILPAGTNPPTNLNIIKGNSGSASFVVTALGGFNGQISIVCAVPTQDDMSCTASPQQMTPTGTVTFVVQTYLTGGPTSALQPGKRPWWPGAAGGTALAGLFMLMLPMGRRARWLNERTRNLLLVSLLLAGLGGAGIGCSSISGSAGNPSSGTPLGVATLTITGASYVNNTVVSHSVFLTVNVLPPGSTAAQPSSGARR